MEWWHVIVGFFIHTWVVSKDFFIHSLVLLNHYALLHPDQLIWIAALCAFVEALPVLGTVFPGSITMTFIGIIAGRGLVGIPETLLFSTIGAFAGDCIGYCLGRIYHEKIPRCWPFKTRPHWLEYGRSFFEKHGGKSVVIGRFIGPLRSTVPLVAGLLRMRAGAFFVAGFFSAFLWAFAYLLPGLLIGAASLAMTPKSTMLFLGVGALAVVGLWGLFWLAGQIFRLTHRAFRRFFVCLSRCCSGQKQCAFVLGLFSKPDEMNNGLALERLAWAIFFLVLFIVIMLSVMMHGALFRLNEPAFHLMMYLRYQCMHAFFTVVTFLGSKPVWLGVSALMSLFFVFSRDWRRLFTLLFSLAAVVAVVHVCKLFIVEPRPSDLMFFVKSNGFPSGHTTIALLIYGLLVFWATEAFSATSLSILRALTLVVFLLLGMSRLYLGVHWLFDVVGGFCLAASLFLAITLFTRRIVDTPVRYPRFMFGLLLAGLVSACSISALYSFKAELHKTTLKWPSKALSLQGWKQDAAHSTALYLDDWSGHPMLPFNVQWVGELSCIQEALKKLGWSEVPHKMTMPGMIRRMTLKSAKDHPRLLAVRYHGQGPTLHMYHAGMLKGEVLSLRLWESGASIQPSGQPMWVGALVRLSPKKEIYNIDFIHRVHFDSGKIAQHFSHSLPDFYHVIYLKNENSSPVIEGSLDWKNNILLVYPKRCDRCGAEGAARRSTKLKKP